MPDPFGVLPMPLPLMIFTSVEDLSTLGYLLLASPSATAIFENHYIKITEAALQHSVASLQTLLRTLVFIRTNRAVIKEKLEHSEDPKRFDIDNLVPEGTGTGALSQDGCSLEAACRLVRSAVYVQQLSQLFLDTHLARVSRLRPSYFVDEQLRQYCQAPSVLPKGQPYQPGLCGPASWVEEQRVHRALWRLELYFSLVYILRDSEGEKNAACNYIWENGPHSVWGGQAYWQLDELDSVHDFLHEMQASSIHLEKLLSHDMQPITVPQRPPGRNDTLFTWMQSTEHLESRSPGASIFQRISSTMYRSPLYKSNFEPFRHLGLGIWHRKRMVWLGLYHGPRKVPLDPETDRDLTQAPEGMPFGRPTYPDELCLRWNSVKIQAEEICALKPRPVARQSRACSRPSMPQ